MSKQFVKLLIPAAQASPQPPVGPALGSRGVKSIDFCKEFNAITAKYKPGVPLPTKITVLPSRKFTFTVSTPPVSWLIKQVAGIEKGAPKPRRGEIIGRINLKEAYEIAKIKGQETEGGVKSVIASCQSMGIQIDR